MTTLTHNPKCRRRAEMSPTFENISQLPHRVKNAPTLPHHTKNATLTARMPQHPQQSQKPAKHHEMFQNLNYIANNALAASEQTHKNKYMQISTRTTTVTNMKRQLYNARNAP